MRTLARAYWRGSRNVKALWFIPSRLVKLFGSTLPIGVVLVSALYTATRMVSAWIFTPYSLEAWAWMVATAALFGLIPVATTFSCRLLDRVS